MTLRMKWYFETDRNLSFMILEALRLVELMK